MVRRLCLTLGVALVAVAASGRLGAAGTPQVPAAPTQSAASQRQLLDQYCVTCHNSRAKVGGLVLDSIDTANVGAQAETWEKVVRKLRAGMMPPPGRPRPDVQAQTAFVSTLEAGLDQAAAAHLNAGRTETLHRLNRFEYSNAVRDVLGLDIDVTTLLPADDASYGFDNMAGVLKLSQSLMERYLSAAARVSRSSVGDTSAAILTKTFTVSREKSQYARVEGLPFGTRGGALVHYMFPQDGEYQISAELLCTTEVDLRCDASGGFTQPFDLEVLVDGTRVQLFHLEPRPVGEEWDGRFTAHVPVKAGPRDVGVTFLKKPSVEYVRSGLRQRFERPFRYYPDAMQIAEPFLDNLRVTGPYNPTGAGDTPSRRRIFTCRPSTAADELRCGRETLARLARRAYRRPVTKADIDDLLPFFNEGREKGGFETGIELGIRRMLVSTNFLFRVEHDPASIAPGANYRVSDLDLASRLSFFLWSSVPDEALLDAAITGTLSQPAVLERQVRRMLADERSHALVDSFFGQWLKLRHVDTLRPSEAMFPDFDAALREAFKQETSLFVENLMREDRSVVDMLTADYTFVNERLARHYGIRNVQGTEFRRVAYPDDCRRGLLGQGSILTLTSGATRTSPVFRGKWVLENVLGVGPPPPPANVPALPEGQAGSKTEALPMRERMAAHRANPVCSACHSMIDPAGFALENFDPIGRWRDVDDAFKPIDATGALPDGTKFSNLEEFRRALAAHPERFIGNLTEKLLTYALGRGVEYYDEPAVRRILHDAALKNYRVSALVMGVVKSMPFQMRRAPVADVATVASARP